MSLCKRLVSLCLCLAMLAAFLLIPVQSATSFAGVKGPTLVKQNGIWYYVKDGAVCKDTTLVKYSGSWYYVKNGTVQSSLTSLVKYNGEWWYVVNGKVASNTTSLVKYNGEWWYVVKGKIASNTTTLIKYNNEWWYVVKGKIAGQTTNLIKYNGEWFYVVKGKVASKTTTLMKYNGGWYYIYKGKLAANTTTLVKHAGKWYYVEGGKVNFGTNTLVPYSGQWYYIKNGTTQPSATTLVKYAGDWYYVKNGVYSASTGFCTYNGQKYYVEDGIAQTSASGKVTVNGSTYFVKNGILTNCHSAGHSYTAATCTTAKVCTKCTYVGGPALGHKMNGNTCTRCGMTEGMQANLKVWAPAEDIGDHDGWLIQMMEQFEAAHPEYDITWDIAVCNEGDAGGMVSVDPVAAADVYLYANDQIGTLVQANAITPITGSYALQVKNDNSQTLVNTVTYTDGKIYGFPMTNNTWFMYYNKDVFSAEDVKSLDTMLTKGRVAFPWTSSWYTGAFFFANGCTVFGPNGNDVSDGFRFGDVQGEQVALAMINLVNHPNMKSDVNGYGNAALKTGEIGATFSGSWDYLGFKEALGDKLGVAVLPTVNINGQQKQMKAFAGSKAVGVNPHSQNKTLAMQFAAFLATPESQKARYEERGVIPAAKSLANDPLIKQNSMAVAEINTMTYASVVQPSVPEIFNYWNPMGNFGAGLVNGEITKDNYKDQVAILEEAMNNPGL